jgi:hypothetical protein
MRILGGGLVLSTELKPSANEGARISAGPHNQVRKFLAGPIWTPVKLTIVCDLKLHKSRSVI